VADVAHQPIRQFLALARGQSKLSIRHSLPYTNPIPMSLLQATRRSRTAFLPDLKLGTPLVNQKATDVRLARASMTGLSTGSVNTASRARDDDGIAEPEVVTLSSRSVSTVVSEAGASLPRVASSPAVSKTRRALPPSARADETPLSSAE
jgi:hypothetical protein